MIGAKHVAAAALLGLLVVGVAALINDRFQHCGRECGKLFWSADIGVKVALLVVGLVGLLAVLLTAHLILRREGAHGGPRRGRGRGLRRLRQARPWSACV